VCQADDVAKIPLDKLAGYLAVNKPRYVPLAAEMPTVGFARNKRWNVIENTTITRFVVFDQLKIAGVC